MHVHREGNGVKITQKNRAKEKECSMGIFMKRDYMVLAKHLKPLVGHTEVTSKQMTSSLKIFLVINRF